MSRASSALALAAAAALLLAPGHALAWIDAGHEVVGALAERRLSLAARAMVREIIGDGHLSDRDVTLWADDHRDRSSAPFHYVDVPFAAGRYDAARDCAGGLCAVAKLEWALAALEREDDPATRLDALRWLVHLAADLHQPLHAAEGWKAGGNRGGVRLGARVGKRSYTSNFHVVWDAEVLWPVLGERRGDEAAAALDAGITPAQAAAWSAVRDPAAWAGESNRLARAIYRELAVTPTRTAWLEVPEAWVTAQGARVREQLGKASVRLAAALDRIAAARAAR